MITAIAARSDIPLDRRRGILGVQDCVPRRAKVDGRNVRLCSAVVANDVEAVRAALADGADINARVRLASPGERASPADPARAALAWAWKVPMAELLLDAGAEIDGTDELGHTALHRAVRNVRSNRTGIVELLLRRGANPNVPLEDACAGGVALVQMLLEAGATITQAALNRATHRPEMLALLEEWPMRSSTASDRDRQLMFAARAGAGETVTALLREGASPIARDANGDTAIDHALKRRHTDVALVLERAAVARHPQAELFLAVLDNMYVRTCNAATRAELEAPSETGMTALMLAARYRRHAAVDGLISSGAKLDPRALVAAIEAGDLEGMRLLLDRGVSVAADQAAILRAACEQYDSDLLKHLLLRRIVVASDPELRTASHEGDRLLRNALAGRLPPAGPTAAWWQDCPLCRDLPGSMGWCLTSNGERTGESLPEVTEQFETFGDLWKCPHCRTFYEHSLDHDNGVTDGYDSEYLFRIAHPKALERLRAMPSHPQVGREIEALTVRVRFDEVAAAPAPGTVQVSGSEERDRTRALMIYRLGRDGAQQLAWRREPEAVHGALVADLTTRGFPVAESDFHCDFVWIAKADGLEVYDSKGKVFDASGDHATLENGAVVARADLARVIAFAEGDYIYRGVKAALRSGKEVALVTEASGSAMGDPVYTRNELLFETGWCTTLGCAIATWAGIGFEDLI